MYGIWFEWLLGTEARNLRVSGSQKISKKEEKSKNITNTQGNWPDSLAIIIAAMFAHVVIMVPVTGHTTRGPDSYTSLVVFKLSYWEFLL